MNDRIVRANGVDLCVETFGAPTDPAILLIMGSSGSMDWWEDEFCERLAGGSRFVIRYDHRDTGRSASWPPGAPGYTGLDLVALQFRVAAGEKVPFRQDEVRRAGSAIELRITAEDARAGFVPSTGANISSKTRCSRLPRTRSRSRRFRSTMARRRTVDSTSYSRLPGAIETPCRWAIAFTAGDMSSGSASRTLPSI